MKPTLRIFLILLIVLLTAALIYLLLSKKPSDIQFDIITQSEDYKIGIYGPVGLQFDQPMDQTSVENHIAFSPRVSGRFEWVENTVWFYPDEPLDAAQGLTLSFSPGAKSADGQTLNSSMERNVSIRPMQV